MRFSDRIQTTAELSYYIISEIFGIGFVES